MLPLISSLLSEENSSLASATHKTGVKLSSLESGTCQKSLKPFLHLCLALVRQVCRWGMDIIGFHYYFNELLVNWRYIQFHFTKNMDSTQQSSDIQKKIDMESPYISFYSFFRLSFAGLVPLSKKKNDRGSLREGF